MSNMTARIRPAAHSEESRYVFHLRTKTPEYLLPEVSYDARAMAIHRSCLAPLAKYANQENQIFGLRVRATPYETELETWFFPPSEPSLPKEDEQVMEIQILCNTIAKVFTDIHNRVVSINQRLKATFDDLERS